MLATILTARLHVSNCVHLPQYVFLCIGNPQTVLKVCKNVIIMVFYNALVVRLASVVMYNGNMYHYSIAVFHYVVAISDFGVAVFHFPSCKL